MDEREPGPLNIHELGGSRFKALRGAALRKPGTHEDFQWGCVLWKVRGKMFCWASPDKDGWAVIKATPDQQDVLVMHPAVEPAPYAGKNGWVKISLVDEAAFELAEDCLDEGYRQVVDKLPKKVQRELEVVD
jgi:predicted DNA-binding protein (MmcQ/YjbR family)